MTKRFEVHEVDSHIPGRWRVLDTTRHDRVDGAWVFETPEAAQAHAGQLEVLFRLSTSAGMATGWETPRDGMSLTELRQLRDTWARYVARAVARGDAPTVRDREAFVRYELAIDKIVGGDERTR